MPWKFVSTDREPLPGIPLEADDREFNAAVEAYEAQYGPEAKGSVKRSGLYAHVAAEAPRPAEGKE